MKQLLFKLKSISTEQYTIAFIVLVILYIVIASILAAFNIINPF